MIKRQFILCWINGNPELSDIAPKRCLRTKHFQNKLIKKEQQFYYSAKYTRVCNIDFEKTSRSIDFYVV